MSSPTAAMPAPSSRAPCIRSETGPWKSSYARTAPRASKYYPDAGSSSAPSHGSGAAAVWPGTSRRPSKAQRPGSLSLTSASSPDASQGTVMSRRVSSQALTETRTSGPRALRASLPLLALISTTVGTRPSMSLLLTLCRCHGENLNCLFEILAEWNEVLRDSSLATLPDHCP